MGPMMMKAVKLIVAAHHLITTSILWTMHETDFYLFQQNLLQVLMLAVGTCNPLVLSEMAASVR